MCKKINTLETMAEETKINYTKVLVAQILADESIHRVPSVSRSKFLFNYINQNS